MRQGYIEPDSAESMHALNVLCVRLVFCLFCEDADLFPKDAFLHYLKDVSPENIRISLKRLFKALDTPYSQRDPYDTTLKPFPYVNGGLFREQSEVPNFDAEMKRFLLEDVSAPVDWSQISPTIFGGIFESTLNPETRRSGGMHYTSPENIHKVIDPLFLDDLKAKFIDIRDSEDLTPRQKKNRYARLHPCRHASDVCPQLFAFRQQDAVEKHRQLPGIRVGVVHELRIMQMRSQQDLRRRDRERAEPAGKLHVRSYVTRVRGADVDE